MDKQRLWRHVSQLLATHGEQKLCIKVNVSESRSKQRQVAGSYEMPNFDVGNIVLVVARIRRIGITPKLTATWTCPFRIVGIESPSLHQVQNVVSGGIQTVHMTRLSFYS